MRFLAGPPPGWGGAAAPGRGFCPGGLCWSGERPLMAAVRRGEGRPGTQRAHDSSERLRQYWRSLARTCLKEEVGKSRATARLSRLYVLFLRSRGSHSVLSRRFLVDICSVININCIFL